VLVENVGTAFEEQHFEDIFLELGSILLSAQDVSGFEEGGVQVVAGSKASDISC
jgi:hypothetical protein